MSQLKWKALGEWSSYLKHLLLSTLQKHDPVVKAIHTGYMYNAVHTGYMYNAMHTRYMYKTMHTRYMYKAMHTRYMYNVYYRVHVYNAYYRVHVQCNAYMVHACTMQRIENHVHMAVIACDHIIPLLTD